MLSEAERVRLMRVALEAAEEGWQAGEVPIGALVARSGKTGSAVILAAGYNESNARQSIIPHAEMVALDQAGVDVTGCILVTTLEPCVMCFGAAIEAGISAIYYALPAPANGAAGRVIAARPDAPSLTLPPLIGGILAEESRDLLSRWLAAQTDQTTNAARFVTELLRQTGGV